jgi:dephospho-CoA kinase
MVRIAVTGGIASGKTLVGSFLAERGVGVCEADALAHDLMKPGQRVYHAVVRAFGAEILLADGSVDRVALGRLVFGDSRQMQRLNAIVHPRVREAWERWLGQRSEPVAVIIPLLYEGGFREGWDAVAVVCAPERRRTQWLAQRGMSKEDARVRIAAQWADERKRKRLTLSSTTVVRKGC